MRINLTTSEILSTDEQALRAYALATAVENGGFATHLPADDPETPAKLTGRFPAYTPPTIGAYQRQGALVGPDVSGAYTHAVVDWTPEEIAAERDRLVAAISSSAREYVESEANAALQIQIMQRIQGGSTAPELLAVYNWGRSVYLEAENRKAQAEAGVADNLAVLCDFSSYGKKPYTVYQLYALGLITL